MSDPSDPKVSGNGSAVPGDQASLSASIIKDVSAEISKQIARLVVVGLLFVIVPTVALGLWGYLRPNFVEVLGGVPSGAVIAMTQECPEDGWEPWLPGTSRMIIGAGDDPADRLTNFGQDEEGEDLTLRRLTDRGGQEMVVLSEDQIHPHTHPFEGDQEIAGAPYVDGLSPRAFSIGGPGESGSYYPDGRVLENEGGEAHVNMPPWIALNYCKRL